MNHLKDETSPYLLQHKDNPVDWYPWGEEAFQRAKAENKPVILSIGYSACHWCHVMAHESFEDPDTAALMNRHFISVKVDREERPEVDDIYMQAVMAMTQGHGGWPLNVFLTPEGRPFYGGTYFPPQSRYGMPAWKDLLMGIHEAFENRRDEINANASELVASLDRTVLGEMTEDMGLNTNLLTAAAVNLRGQFDKQHGGFGGAPKFPNPMNLEFLLRTYQRTQHADTLHVVTYSLDKMARGGIYDQVGGGFHRYSVDAYWLVPHFEKMLYDNAQLSRLYLHAWQVTGNAFYREIAEDIYDYILREMTAPEGGFYSATDADSEGEEGKFFIWTMDEVRMALKPLLDDLPNAAEIAIEYWGMTASGNFEGHNILYVPNDDATVAKRLGLTVEDLKDALTKIKDRLYATRTNRIAPGLDDKILTGWNGMMLASLAEAARVLDRPDYLTAAERAGAFLLDTMMTADGRLQRTYKDGRARINAVLEDYGHMIDALLELYQSTFIERWFIAAQKLAEAVLTHFSAQDYGFFDTSDDHEALIVRPRSLQDNATPSGNSIMAKQLSRLAAYTGEGRYDDAARSALRPMIQAMRMVPQAFGEALNAADNLTSGIVEVALLGNPTHAEMKTILYTLRRAYRPTLITALSRQDTDETAVIPLLRQRTIRGDQPTVYVCRHFACARPVNTAQEMEGLL